MLSKANSVEDYLAVVADDKKEAFNQLRETIKKNLPKGFEEEMYYGMIGYVVPKKKYPAGYHCNPALPLGFINIAAQKNFIAIYHMGIYADAKLLNWFVDAYTKLNIGKLDMGKSCIRFKKTSQIPFELIAELMKKMSVDDWIACYESAFKINSRTK